MTLAEYQLRKRAVAYLLLHTHVYRSTGVRPLEYSVRFLPQMSQLCVSCQSEPESCPDYDARRSTNRLDIHIYKHIYIYISIYRGRNERSTILLMQSSGAPRSLL